jgi:hypothetical protein
MELWGIEEKFLFSVLGHMSGIETLLSSVLLSMP